MGDYTLENNILRHTGQARQKRLVEQDTFQRIAKERGNQRNMKTAQATEEFQWRIQWCSNSNAIRKGLLCSIGVEDKRRQGDFISVTICHTVTHCIWWVIAYLVPEDGGCLPSPNQRNSPLAFAAPFHHSLSGSHLHRPPFSVWFLDF